MKAKYAVALDLGGTNFKIGIVDIKGKVLTKESAPTARFSSKEKLIRAITSYSKNAPSKINLKPKQIAGIGIGAPGLIDSEKGIIRYFVNIKGWRNVNIRKIIRKETRLPLYIDNDVNMMTIGELAFGAGKKATNAICLTLGTGVGGGIVINRELYRGSSLTAGEIGHTILNENGPKCNCGSTGCLEAYIGNSRIIASAVKAIKAGRKSKITKLVNGKLSDITPVTIEDAAREGDKLAIQIWEEVGQHLGTALADLVNILNPDTIIIGGGVAKAGKLLFEPTRRTVRKKAMAFARNAVKIVHAKLGSDAGLIGSGYYVLDSLNKK